MDSRRMISALIRKAAEMKNEIVHDFEVFDTEERDGLIAANIIGLCLMAKFGVADGQKLIHTCSHDGILSLLELTPLLEKELRTLAMLRDDLQQIAKDFEQKP